MRKHVTITEQDTMPLKAYAPPACPLKEVNISLQTYIHFYQLQWQDAARAGGLLLVVAWRALHNLPVSVAQAAALRNGLYRLTRIPYTGPIPTRPVEFQSRPRDRKERSSPGRVFLTR